VLLGGRLCGGGCGLGVFGEGGGAKAAGEAGYGEPCLG